MKPLALVTNDDGIRSQFMLELALALSPAYEVWTVAPEGERSWIGRAITRVGSVKAEKADGLGFPGPAWSISGTPSDAVNIALSHLLPRRPAVVASGVNIGYNTTLQLILSSGTVGAALEGAAWGIPSLACSMVVPRDVFPEVRGADGACEGEVRASLLAACAHTACIAQEIAGGESGGLCVHNLNFPMPTSADTPIESSVPGSIYLGPLFVAEESEPGSYRFQYSAGEPRPQTENADRAVIERGHASHTILDFQKLAR